jgi:Zn-dependent protease with chaperone function
MPAEFNLHAALVGATVIALYIVWTHGGFIWVGQMFGFFGPPPEALQTIVRETAARMKVVVKRVSVMRVSLAQAFALPPVGTLIFTERLLELCPAEEIDAICAHELAHLAERPGQYAQRYVVWLTFLPWIFITPTLHTFGSLGLLLLASTAILGPALYRRVSRKLEVRADQMAHAHEPEDQAYARALARLYQDNLLPAVHAKRQATHPHLYDRLVAAGMTPDFARPKPAKLMAWHGKLFGAVFGALVGLAIFGFKRFL